jgi:hypothetical protein
MKKRLVFVAIMIAMITLTQIIVSPVFATYGIEETILDPVSGSNVDPTTFEFIGHLVADGFVTDISMDLPVPKSTTTQTKVGFAVGLGDPWTIDYVTYTPYVNEMSLKVNGSYEYTAYTGGILDNQGTGAGTFLEVILEGLGYLVLTYEIYGFLKEAYEGPPCIEWQPTAPTHWVRAITRQSTHWVPLWYTAIDDPPLQTAGASFLSYFEEDGPNTLDITAQAEIRVQVFDYAAATFCHLYVGTYQVNFEVSVPVGVYDLSVRTYLTNGDPIFDVEVWIDDDPARYSWVTTEVGYGTHSVKVDNLFYRDSYKYTFEYWQGGGSSNPRTVDIFGDMTLRAYYAKTYVGGGGGEPCPTLFVWDGSGYVDYGVIDIHDPSGDDIIREVSVQTDNVGIGNHKALFRLREGWPGLDFSESVIDQVKLYAVDNEGEWSLCPLISAEHSTLGKVLPQLLASDDIKAQMLLLETIDLTFVVPYKNVQGFMFVIEGNNQLKM